jgi:hypothetical protein
LTNGTIKTTRKFHTIRPSRGENALPKKPAELQQDPILIALKTAPTRNEAAVVHAEQRALDFIEN